MTSTTERLGEEQVLQLVRARVCAIMTSYADAGRLSLLSPLEWRAGFAIGILGRLLGIPAEVRPEWSQQLEIEAVGISIARLHESGMLDRAAATGPWSRSEGCER